MKSKYIIEQIKFFLHKLYAHKILLLFILIVNFLFVGWTLFYLSIPRASGYLPRIPEFSPTNVVKADEKPTYKLLFGGDVMLARNVGAGILYNNFDPFKNIRQTLTSADLTVANLECVISDKGFQNPNKLYTFRAPTQAMDVLASSGIDVVSVANNHSADYGISAFTDSLSRLQAANIGYFGGGNNAAEAYLPKYVVVGNLKVALIGFVNVETPYFTATASQPGVAWWDEGKIIEAIKTAQAEADFVVVVPHWGYEYTSDLSVDQPQLAHKMIDAGADAVIGSHPHHIQAQETYNGKYIHYSMGNFVFDGPGPNTGWYQGELVQLEVNEDGVLAGTKTIPYSLDNSGLVTLR